MDHQHERDTPPLVAEAVKLANRMGFAKSCSPETGRLLQVCAAQIQEGVIGEIGTGSGVGASWMVSNLRPGGSFITIEIEEHLARAAQRLLARVTRARVLHGDWREILSYDPFALLFVDAAPAKQHEPETPLEALRLGGVIVLDDLTPGRQRDPLREFWLTDPRVVATEVLVRATEAVILATRIE